MRNLLRTDGWLIAVLIALGALSYAATSGCKTKPENVAYRTSGAAHVTAIAALKAWSDYVSLNHPPVEQEKKVQAAFDSYKKAQLTLLDATKAYMAAGLPPPATVQEKFDLALQSAGDALAELINLVQSFGARVK